MTVAEPNPYLEKVRLKRKKNQEKIDALGIADMTEKKPRTTRPLTKIPQHATGTPPRRSARVSKEPVKFKALDASADSDDRLLQKRLQNRVKNSKNRGSLKKRKFDLGQQISPSKRALFEPISTADWVADMKYYFSVEEGNSASNVQRVMTVVNKLVVGKGVRHPQTQEYFLNKTNVHLGMDFRKLLDEASEWVYNSGGDRGNGWLIEHPVKKLWVYQQARFQRGKPFSVERMEPKPIDREKNPEEFI
jgi:hypothetical protein